VDIPHSYIETAFNRIFHLTYPIAIAPMKEISGPRLVAEAAVAGALGEYLKFQVLLYTVQFIYFTCMYIGFLGETKQGGVELQRKRLQEAQQLALLKTEDSRVQTQSELVQLQTDVTRRIGVGFVIQPTGPLSVKETEAYLKSLIEAKPDNVWLTLPLNSQVQHYIRLVQQFIHAHALRTKIFAQVHSATDAMLAAEAGAHVIVLRCAEARGLKQLSDYRESLSELFHSTEQLLVSQHEALTSAGMKQPLLLAAGGIRTGQDMNYALDLG
jgi:NAD(P)H-dependent flavin oxidoreductase YrpB (nitropropane dioxygenase family)